MFQTELWKIPPSGGQSELAAINCPKHIPPKEPTPRGYVGSRNLDLNSQWPVTYVKPKMEAAFFWDIFWSFFLGGDQVEDLPTWCRNWISNLNNMPSVFLQSSSWLVEHSYIILQTSCHTEASSQNHVHAKSRSIQWFVNPGRSFNSGSGEVATLRKK